MSLRHQYLISAADNSLANSKKSKPFRILEIGCNDARRGRQVIDRAIKFGRKLIEYFGFDVFEEYNAAIAATETSKAFRVIELDTVKTLILRNNRTTVVSLFKGDSKKTLPENVKTLPVMNIIFARGGHSLPTVQSDIEYALKLANQSTELVLDNYYPGDYTKGCAFIVDTDLSKRPGLSVKIMPHSDVYSDLGIEIKLVTVKKLDRPGSLPAIPVVIPEYVPEDVVGTSEIKHNAEPVEEVSDVHSDTDVQPARLCAKGCTDGPCEYSEQPCDSSGRCESRVVPVHLEYPTSGPVSDTPVSEERQEPDQKLELGTNEVEGDANTNDCSNEQRCVIPEGVAPSSVKNSGKRKRRSRRSNNERTGPSSETAGS